MNKKKNEIDEDEGINSFLEEDEDTQGGNKVSFQLDIFGNTITDMDDDVELELPESENQKPEPQVVVEDDAPEEEDSFEEEEVETKKKEELEAKRKSRAKDRIKNLAQEKRELQNLVNKQNQELAQIKAEYDETTTTYAKVELERLISDVARLEARLKTAANDGDGEAIASITKQLVDSQGHIRHLQGLADRAPQNQPEYKNTPPQQSELSEAAEDWAMGKEFIINNDEYRDLTKEQRKKISPLRQAMADTARQLLSEGFTNDDPLFYEEMDIRLASKFDYYEALANEGLDALEYNHSESGKTDNGASGETGKPQEPNKAKNVPAKGPSRSSSPNLNSSSKDSNKVVITPEMHKYWKNHLSKHMTLKEYALEIKKDQQRTKF